MDILSLIRELYINLAHNLPDHVFSFLLRANLLLLCPAATAYAGFSQGVRNQKVQTSLMAIGVLVGLSIPVEFMLGASAWRPLMVLVLVLGCWFHPLILAPLAHPYPGIQVKVVRYTRTALAVLFILNLFIGR